jgi:general secretion pathway protein K
MPGRRHACGYLRGSTIGVGRRRSRAGMALVMVLWVVTLLTVIAASFTLGMRREAGTIRHMVEVAEARAAAEAGVRFAMLGLLETDQELAWQPDGRPRELVFGGMALTIRVTDESGRVDLNVADEELLGSLLRSAGLEDEGARLALMDNILDWRDPSPDHRAAGMSEADYRAAGFEYGPRNGPFLGLEELLLVPGVTPELYRRLLPLLTIYSFQGGVNLLAASAEVLRALPDVDPETVEAYLALREEAWEQGLPAPPFDALGLGAAGGVAYSVQSVARTASGLQQGLRVVLVPETETGREPFRIVHYRLEEAP